MPRLVKTCRINLLDALIGALAIAWNLGSVVAIGAALRGLAY